MGLASNFQTHQGIWEGMLLNNLDSSVVSLYFFLDRLEVRNSKQGDVEDF